MINIDKVVKKWLIEHNHYEFEPSFKEDFSSLCQLINDILDHEGLIISGDEFGNMYDPNFGDNKKCECGHSYYRHFDSYDDMAPVGCKYCCHWGPDPSVESDYHGKGHCTGFKEKTK